MRLDSAGHWFVDLPLKPGKYQYKFVVNGEWVHDRANPEAVEDGRGGKNSVMTVPESTQLAQVAAAVPLVSHVAPVRDVCWTRINYPDVPIPGTNGKTMSFFVRPDGRENPSDEAKHLYFSILWSAETGAEKPAALANPDDIIVRLHLPDGVVITPEPIMHPGWDGAGKAEYMTWSRAYRFQWARNAYDEAWIECRLPGQTYWAEIPYGFSRNPAEPWPADDRERGNPAVAAAMRNLPAADRLVPWLHVSYDLGEIQNGWRLQANLANPFDPAVEVVLYHAPVGDVPTGVDQPRTAVDVKRTGESDMTGRRVGSYIRAFEHMDVFLLSRSGGDELGRGHAMVAVQVENERYAFPVPTSLLKYMHGTAEPQDTRRLPRGHGLFELISRSAQ